MNAPVKDFPNKEAFTFCRHCGQLILPKCAKCARFLVPEENTYRLPNPFGSLDARHPLVVCRSCYTDYARLGFTWIGLPDPGPEIFGPAFTVEKRTDGK